MVYELTCGDVMDGCAFQVRSEDEEEVVDLGLQHGERVHDTSFDREQVRELVKST